ncbi:MAG: hypothetical protein ABIQ17_06690 [Candidatus Limnocylindrales bacterium]
MTDEVDPREAERIRRRNRALEAEQRALMKPGMGKVFKQILDKQAQAAHQEPAKPKSRRKSRP